MFYLCAFFCCNDTLTKQFWLYKSFFIRRKSIKEVSGVYHDQIMDQILVLFQERFGIFHVAVLVAG
jgi:hypothetical protein